MIAVIEAQDAWWPPTFSPSRLSRRWLALWMVQLESQRSRTSSCVRASISSARSAAGWVLGAAEVGFIGQGSRAGSRCGAPAALTAVTLEIKSKVLTAGYSSLAFVGSLRSKAGSASASGFKQGSRRRPHGAAGADGLAALLRAALRRANSTPG